MGSVPGLDRALKLYDTEKIRDRAQGSQILREIFSNRENLEVFQERAQQNGGAGWVSLFQVLFTVVLIEKKAVGRKTGGAPAERRLAEAVSLVRFIAERSVHLLSRKPFITLFTHMTTLLVQDRRIYERVAIDYIKALRALLSFPPHLENVDPVMWRMFMGVCWAALLGDKVSLDDDEAWGEGGSDGEEGDDGDESGGSSRYAISASVATELLSLVPILLSSSRAPLLSSPPPLESATPTQPSLGCVLLFKISRYLHQLPSHATIPLEVLRSLNIVLGELELNHKDEFTAASLKLFPQLVAAWTSRSKGDLSLRESALVSLRIMLPYVTHHTVVDSDSKEAVREAMGRLIDWIGKETGSRGAVRPLDIRTLRLDSSLAQRSSRGPFQLAGVIAGFGFDASQAINWAAVELYADCCYQTLDAYAPPSTLSQTQRRKRQRTENGLDKMLAFINNGQLQTRQLACQIVVFLLDKYWANIQFDARIAIRSKLLELLDDADTMIQSWSFIGLACLATLDEKPANDGHVLALPGTPAALASRRRQEQPAWERLWTHAVRKTSVKGVSRAACHAANVVLNTGKVDHAQCIRDIHTFLKNVDIQGPASISEASSAFLVSCLAAVRADAGLYSANLEDKVLDWFSRTFLGEGLHSKSRLSSATPSNNLDLLSSICHFSSPGIADVSVVEHLPDCPIVNRILQEVETAPIRDVILRGIIPEQPETEDTLQLVRTESNRSETSLDSLTTLEGRERKLSGVLRTAVDSVREEWTTNDRSTLITAERLRKGIDLVVLVFAFQATIQANGYRPDSTGCLQPAAALLQLLLPHLRNFSDNIPHQHLAWRGFMPLYYRATSWSEYWPIMLKPDEASGIRRDILSPTRYATHHTDAEEPGNSPRDKLLAIIWRRTETQDALSQVIETSKAVMENVRAPLRNAAGGAAMNAMDDDDFGPILTAEVEQSSEAKEAHRSTESLLKTLVDLRLRGPLLASPAYRSTKDIPLLNSFLGAEGARFVQLGLIICDAIKEGSLRLTLDAVDLILEQLCDRLASYLFQRDGSLIRLAIVFLMRSVSLWLTPDCGLTEQAIELARMLMATAEAGKLSDWQARLQLLVFIDEYLEFDPSYSVWTQFSDTEQADIVMGGDGQFSWGPLSYILDATGDVDSRVRFRAISSAAGIHYLPDLSAEQKSRAYFDVLGRQSAISYSWDHYITNMLWKLNTCLASAQLRSATMFHLYEIADFNQSFLEYLQPGLEAVAQRLGLDSLKPLFLAHANIIVLNQLQNQQLPLGLPCALYGCTSRKEFAQLTLEAVGPKLLAHHRESWSLAFFADACQAALIPEDQARERHLPYGAAIAVAEAIRDMDSPSQDDIIQTGTDVLAALPPPREDLPVERVLKSRIDFIIANLIGLTDLTLSNAALAQVLGDIEQGTAGDTFLQLLSHDADSDHSPSVLDPSAPDTAVLQAHAFFRRTFRNVAKRRMVFNGIVRLFYAVNDAYLVNEQRRYLRAIAILVSLYSSEFSQATVLQQFLSNVVALLPKDDIGGVAMSMLEWGFDQVANCQRQKPDLVDILIDLGSVRAKLQSIPHLQPVAERLDAWVASKAQSWMRESTMEVALETALVFWPSEWAANFPKGLEFQFDTVARIAERPRIQNPIALCQRLDETISSNDAAQREQFVSSTFWYLKKALNTSQWDSKGAMAFLDLVYKTSGEVHAPSLPTIRGLTGRSLLLEHGKKYTKLPTLGLRVLVMGRLVQQTLTDDFRLRTTTFEVLQSALPILKAMLEETPTAVPNYLRDLIVNLVPTTFAAPVQQVDLGVLTAETSGPGWVQKSRAHGTWAKELALMLGTLAAQDDPFYACLRPLLSSDGNAAIELLPYLVQAVLTCAAVTHPDDTAARAAILTGHFTQVLQFPMAAPETIEAIINIILHLRHFQPPYGSGELSYNHWLDIDTIVLSEAAGKCGAYASSLLFLEMANDRDEGETTLDLSSPRVQKIMYDIYSNVEDPDGFYGIQNNDVMDSLLRRLDHEVQPVKSLGYNLASYETASTGASQPLVASLRNLHDLGFHSFAGTFMKTKRREGATDSTSDPFFLELAWRMGDWDVPITQDLAETTPGRFYNALRAVHRERDREAVRRIVDDTIHHEMTRLQKIGVERMTEIKSATTNLLCLRDIAQWVSAPMQTAIDHSDFEGSLLSGFSTLNPSFDFANAERLFATRLSLIRSARAREDRNLLGDLVSSQSEGLIGLEINCQLRLSELARKEGNLQAAVNAVTAIRQLESGYLPSDRAQDEFSQVLWAQGHHSLAIQHITGITEKLNPKTDGRRQALLLGRSAHWTALAKLKAAEEIRRTFRQSMHQAGEQGASKREQAQISFEFASWADNYYATLSRSPELERLKSFVTRKKEVFQQLDASLKSAPGSPRADAEKELEEERASKERMEKEMLRYLQYALHSYSLALSLCDDYDDCITRLCSLWLAHDTNEDANRWFQQQLRVIDIASHKFIVLAPQLAARLFRPKTQTAFNSVLNSLMLRLAEEHPYHVLYQIITLAASAPRPTASSRSKAAPSSSMDGRSAAAAEIMERLRTDKAHPLASAASVNMTHFANAAVEWSQFCHDNKDKTRPGKDMTVPSNCALLQCRGLRIPIATVVPAIDLTLQYANLPTIDRYRSTYRAAGGIHRPAIMTVIDTLGREHIQLFKAEDEVRQDAVMEQVFDMTNRLLSRDRKASLRKLLFRTYTVIPLYNKTGIIEFVGDTTAIGDWLKDAHTRYRKGIDITADVVRKQLASVQEKDHASEKLVSIYDHAMANFQPVMRHFFTEKRREPLAWFSMRLNYARSVAVTSMVGYMVGLGDRHCSNILIDKKTGELVHIDFGIVFEEGRKLRIPEKVPFRLTNDIVDGLGLTGVNGTFRQCAEHTLRVLRDSSDLILTVLEVFKHDPLYAWTGDPSKMRRAQGGGRLDPTAAQTHGQDKAERVLTRIRQKLGRELSVEYTVNMLIQEARDPEHLAKIYVGWQPWL